MEPKSTYSGNDSYFDGRDKELDASYLCRKLCKKKYQLEFEKGEIIIAQGEDVDACYYLEKGYVIPLYEYTRTWQLRDHLAGLAADHMGGYWLGGIQRVN